MSSPELSLSNQVCFRVYSLDRALQAAYRSLLADLGVTYSQYLVLLALWETDGPTIGELCARLRLDTGTVSPLVKRMERDGLVSRVRRRDDERSVTVLLTEKGAGLEGKARSVPGRLASCVFGSAGDYTELREALDKALGALETALSDGSLDRCGA